MLEAFWLLGLASASWPAFDQVAVSTWIDGATGGLEQCHDSLEFGLEFSGGTGIFIELATDGFELSAGIIGVALADCCPGPYEGVG